MNTFQVLQRDTIVASKISVLQACTERANRNPENLVDENNKSCPVPVTDLDEEDCESKTLPETTNTEVGCIKMEAYYAAALKEFKDTHTSSKETKTPTADLSSPMPQVSTETLPDEPKRGSKQHHHHNQKQPRSIKTVLKRNKSCANDVKVNIHGFIYCII